MGVTIAEPTVQKLAPGAKRPPSCELICPTFPVREIVGKYCALATPICAFAEINCCSAWVISGRLINKSEGKPAGIVGSLSVSRVKPRGMEPGFLPNKTFKAFSVKAMRCS